MSDFIKYDDETKEFFAKIEDKIGDSFKKLQVNTNLELNIFREKTKLIIEVYDSRRARLKEYYQLKAFEDAFEAFLNECGKEKSTERFCFSKQVNSFSNSTGISVFVLMHMTLWLNQRPKRIARIREAITPKAQPKEFWELT
jgi:hypothetical protein